MFDFFFLLFLFVISGFGGFLPPYIWGKNGGDEGLITTNPKLKFILKALHHWHIGLALVILSGIMYYFFGINPYICTSILGWGFVTFLDDAFFHSYENYFMRKTC